MIVHCSFSVNGRLISDGLVGGSAKFSLWIRTFTSHIGGLKDLKIIPLPSLKGSTSHVAHVRMLLIVFSQMVVSSETIYLFIIFGATPTEFTQILRFVTPYYHR